LFGAASAIRERSGAPLWPDEQTHFESAIETARAALGDSYDKAISAGRSLSLDEVVREANAVARALMDLSADKQPERTPDASGLSPREIDVLRLLAAGHSNLDIADALFVSRGTVRTHVSSILAKLDAKSRTEAAAIAHRQGLI
jgi:DNA-binding NarL/FixJ family response regulator